MAENWFTSVGNRMTSDHENKCECCERVPDLLAELATAKDELVFLKRAKEAAKQLLETGNILKVKPALDALSTAYWGPSKTARRS